MHCLGFYRQRVMGDKRRELVHGLTQFTGAGFKSWRKFSVDKQRKSDRLLDAVKKNAPTFSAELAKFQEMAGKAVNLIIFFLWRANGLLKTLNVSVYAKLVEDSNIRGIWRRSMSLSGISNRWERNLTKSAWFRNWSLIFGNPTILRSALKPVWK